jgi:hypothetical protein
MANLSLSESIAVMDERKRLTHPQTRRKGCQVSRRGEKLGEVVEIGLSHALNHEASCDSHGCSRVLSKRLSESARRSKRMLTTLHCRDRVAEASWPFRIS